MPPAAREPYKKRKMDGEQGEERETDGMGQGGGTPRPALPPLTPRSPQRDPPPPPPNVAAHGDGPRAPPPSQLLPAANASSRREAAAAAAASITRYSSSSTTPYATAKRKTRR